jgi:spore germination cell wall hydrolase CwlJ-like protein
MNRVHSPRFPATAGAVCLQPRQFSCWNHNDPNRARIVNLAPDADAMMQSLKKALQESWRQMRDKPLPELLEARFEKLISYGKFKEVEAK